MTAIPPHQLSYEFVTWVTSGGAGNPEDLMTEKSHNSGEPMSGMNKKNIALICTGGTIEKTYDELEGVLENRVSVLDMMLASLVLNGVTVERILLMNKDSLEMAEEDHDSIAVMVERCSRTHDGVLVVHGTDRLAVTGERIYHQASPPLVPIVLTGAIRPWELRNTDSLQNLTEALLAVQLLSPGVYVSMHNRVLQFPGVFKDHKSGTFVRE